MEPKRDGPETTQASYKIIVIPGTHLKGTFLHKVFATFLRSLRLGNYYWKLIDKDSYFHNYHRYIEALLARPLVNVKFAVLSDEPDTILGWAVVEPGTVHYVWVDPLQRGAGIAKMLCSDPFHTITHLTTIGAKIFKTMPHVRFDPWR